MTFTCLWEKIIATLKENAEELGVDPDKIKEILPMQIIKTNPPYIFVCVAPMTSDKSAVRTETHRRADVDIFCAEAKVEGEGIQKAGILVERMHLIENIIANIPGVGYWDDDLGYDYSNPGVLQLTLNFNTNYEAL